MVTVSIVIPTYNAAKYLPETLETVLMQSYKDYEIIVVDDGSDDNTKDVLSPYRNRIRYFYQENSGGPAGPRNVGIQFARGKFISFFDSDDIMLQGKLDRAVKFLCDEPSIGMVFTNFQKFNEAEDYYSKPFLDQLEYFQKLEKINLGDKRFIIRSDILFEALLLWNFIGTSGVLCRKAIFSKVGLFDEEVTYGGLEDLDMWFRIARFSDVGYLDEIDHLYRDRIGSVSKRAIASNQSRIIVLRRYLNEAKQADKRRGARRIIAQCYYSIGYQYQVRGKLKRAREFYIKSLSNACIIAASKGILMTLIGIKATKFLKYFLYRDNKE